jgi:hypothetical protein
MQPGKEQASLRLGILICVTKFSARPFALLFAVCFAALSGCKQATVPVPSLPALPKIENNQQARTEAQAHDYYRQQMEQIPPPAKSRYVDVHSPDAWENPMLSADVDTITLRVMQTDALPVKTGNGGMLRPKGARRQELTLHYAELQDALLAIPTGAWPYGRVIAISESPVADPKSRAQIRRKIEGTIQTLNDMGIVVDEWPGR